MKWQDFPTLKLLIQAAKELKIESQVVGKVGFVKFQKDKSTAYFYRSRTPLNNHISVVISESKYLASKILDDIGVPTQKYHFCPTIWSAKKIASQIGFPLVVKPNVGTKGQGVTANINSQRELNEALKYAQQFHPKIVLSPHFPGEDYRLLVLKNQVIGAIKREPPQITGDGRKTIEELIDSENQKRLKINQKRIVPLKMIKLDHEVQRQLQNHQLQPDSVLSSGQVLILRANANWSTGGTATTIAMEKFHPRIIKTAIQASQSLTLGFSGVDLILQDLEKPLKGNGIILEINANAAIGVFHQPVSGLSQKVAAKILEASCA